ncbi:hypothetical protein A0U92_15735 [Acetobacter aceti]|uniref:Uncharacterized protein n=1 Tax=Acetobacter aceti TaxID=435 RepID=A0A1U9KJR6_ACEAC|nr:hypothetical protein A0U92_15735 [Acetobacter aceti]
MFGPFLRATSGPVVADSLLVFHLTGSLLHAAFAFLGYVISDRPDRLRHNLPLAPYDRATFYVGGAHGYTDYPHTKVSE